MSSGMWRCVYPGLTDVSEERIASIFREENSKSGEPASAGGRRLSQRSETPAIQEQGGRGFRPDGKSTERGVGSG
jgi:hypothetical protein